MDFDSHVRRLLADLEERHLLRSPRSVTGPQGPELEVQGRRVIGLCSNNYLGLAGDPRIASAAAEASERTGFGSGASRHISGSHTLHLELERALASFVGLPNALLFSSGYAANVGAIQALAGRDTAIFSDRLNHASLIDGARLSRASIFVYDHLDLDHLEHLLAAHRASFPQALVLSESLFSMEGDVADLVGLRALASRFEAGLVVDEAHALGIFGPHGAGLARAASIQPDLLIGTLGKALGCAGAFAAGTPTTVRLLENRARSYVFSTASPPSQAAAARTALALVAAADDRREQLATRAAQLRSGLSALGLPLLPGPSPIIPVILGSPERTMAFSGKLLEQGVFVHGVRPPTVPPGSSRLRVVPMATHSIEHIAAALAAFERCL